MRSASRSSRAAATGALVLTDAFFPPARNGRGTRRRSATTPPTGSPTCDRCAAGPALRLESTSRSGGLRRRSPAWPGWGLDRAAFDADADAVAAPVLVVHARDDHHVPIDFALAAIARHPSWEMRALDRGGHHAHVTEPGPWLAAVSPWLEAR